MKVDVTSHVDEVLQQSEAAAQRALEMCGLLAEKYAKALCPVDTGRLRNSITHQTDETSTMVGTNVEYAPYVELGTSRKAARPYIAPSIQNHMGEYRTIIESELRK